MLQVVRAPFLVVAFEERDAPAVRAPLEARPRDAGRGRRERSLGGSRSRVRDEYLSRWLAVGIGRAIRDERDPCPVRRPGWRGLVGRSRGQAIELFRGDVEQIDIAVTARQQIPLSVLLELVPIDDNRLRHARAGGGGVSRGGRLRIRVGIADDEGQPRRIGRPFMRLQTSLHAGQLKRLTAAAIQQPHLVALRRARPRRGER